MSGFPYDDLVDEEVTAEIEKALPGKADGKGDTKSLTLTSIRGDSTNG